MKKIVNDSSSPSFWEERYQRKQTPWDFHGVPLAFKNFLSCAKPSRVLVPGCGSAYEVKAFIDHGWDAYGIDFSPTAAQQARTTLGKKGERILCDNFFEHSFEKPFDFIYERTFLCALPLRLRKAYVRRVRELLVPGGQLVGFFFYGEKEEGPPYPLKNLEEAKSLLSGFHLHNDSAVEDSVSVMIGGERWQEWKVSGSI